MPIELAQMKVGFGVMTGVAGFVLMATIAGAADALQPEALVTVRSSVVLPDGPAV